MDPQIIAAIIGGVATVVAAVVAAVLGIRTGRRRGGTDSGVASTQESPPQEATPPKQSSRELDATEGPPAKKEPQTHVVDPVEGDFATISEAIRAAAPKDKILVRPGWYREGLVVDKPLGIAGDGRSEDIVVLGDGKSALQFSVTTGRVRNMTLRQVNREAQIFAVTITQGRLTLTECDISNRSLSGVGVYDGADPVLRGNRIHDNNQSGVYVYNNGLGVLEENDIFANGSPGVAVIYGGNPVLHNNRIHDNNQDGVHVYEAGKGTLEGNDIFANAYHGVEIREAGHPTVRDNRINKNQQWAVRVYEQSSGTVEGNDLSGNASGALSVSDDSESNLIRNNNKT